VNIGSINFNDAISYGASGPISKSLGLKKDLRISKEDTYAFY
jgi:NADH:ubiquinone oxidoreductase subunit D